MNFSRRLLEDAYVIRDPFSPTTGHLTLGGQCCLCSKDICVAPVRLNYRIPGLQEIDSSDFRSPEVGISVTLMDKGHNYYAWVQNGLLPTCCTCSTKILCDSWSVFLKYAKIKQRKGLLAEWDLVYTHGGYSWEFLMGVCCPVLQILTRFQTKKRNFSTRFQARP